MTLGLHEGRTRMTDQDEKPTTIFLTPTYVRRADAIGRAMTPTNGIQPKRSAVVQKAIDDLFSRLGLVDEPERQVA